MIEEVYEAYLLSQEELGILLRAAGCAAFYGFPMEVPSCSRKELLLELHRMVQKGFLKSDGVHFLMEPVLATCIRTIAGAKKMLLITVQDPPLPVYCCYPGRQILICEWMNRRGNYVKLKQIAKAKFWEILEEEGYFPAMGEGHYQMFDNHTGREKRKLILQREGLEQTLLLEMEGEQVGAIYSRESMTQMFRTLTGGEFYDIS